MPSFKYKPVLPKKKETVKDIFKYLSPYYKLLKKEYIIQNPKKDSFK